MGLWLRFDSKTAGLFEGDNSPTVFFTGEKLLLSQSCTRNDHRLFAYWPILIFTIDGELWQ